MLLQLGVDGLSETGFLETDYLRPFDSEEFLQFLRGVVLDDGIMFEIRQDGRAAIVRQIAREQHKM